MDIKRGKIIGRPRTRFIAILTKYIPLYKSNEFSTFRSGRLIKTHCSRYKGL